MNGRITKFHIATKTIWQIILYILEIVIFCGILTFLSFRFIDPQLNRTIIDVLERFTLFYTIYQIIVFVILNNINDIKADEYLALKNISNISLLAVESKEKINLSNAEKAIDAQLEGDVFNDIEVRKTYQTLKQLLINKNSFGIKTIIIWAEHCAETEKLQWRFSFFLRVAKGHNRRKT